MEKEKPHFSGWATRSNVKCTDGRTIMHNAFSHQDNYQVPLVWKHQRNDPVNVLGHANLEDRAFGVYAYGYFDLDNPKAVEAKKLVDEKKINALSIYATGLTQRGQKVYHGDIEEVSLVPSGANPGALIENVHLTHGYGLDETSDEAIIYSGLTLEHQDSDDEGADVAETTETSGKTIQDVLDTMNQEQKDALYHLLGKVVEESGLEEEPDDKDDSDSKDKEEDDSDKKEVEHEDADQEDQQESVEHSETTITKDEFLSHIDNHIESTMKEGFKTMTRNAFEQYGQGTPSEKETLGSSTLTHADFSTLIADARKSGGTLKEAVLEHADEYGISNIEMLFPDAKNLNNQPDFISRRMEWVQAVLSGTKHSPFAKVKTVHADITEPEARAKGYITGKRKKEEVFKLLKRTTAPTTIYKKQKLDRDDILDITDFDVVVWLRQEMRLMLEEEIARAILVGDGRDALDEDKVKDPEGAVQGEGIRSILHDDELYAHPVNLPANVAPKDMVKGIVRARSHYRGSGRPSLFISDTAMTDLMLEEDKFGRPLYASEQELADKLRVSNIVTIELFDETEDLLAILVNLQDYTVGANKGGEITNFEDFDIDFNQHKYLMETRLSGGLTKPKSAIVVKRAQGTAVTPSAPSFDTETNMIEIPSVTGVIYYINDDVATGVVQIEETTEVEAVPAEGYYFNNGATRSWTFTYTETQA